MYSIGIIGGFDQVDELGRIITSIEGFDYSGSFHPKPDPTRYFHDNTHATVFTSFPAFQASCDAIIVENTNLIEPSQIATALKTAKPVLLAKPLHWQNTELEYLFKIAEEANTQFKLRNTFAYQPIIRSAGQYIRQPAFIDYHIDISAETPSARLQEQIIHAIFNCLDAIFHINPAQLKRFNTVISPELFGLPGVIHGRIEFDNGCVANITLNGYAEQDRSSCSIYQESRHVVLNFLSQRLTVKDKLPGQDKLKSSTVSLEIKNPVVEEMTHFLHTSSFPDQFLGVSDHSLQSFLLARKMIENLSPEKVSV